MIPNASTARTEGVCIGRGCIYRGQKPAWRTGEEGEARIGASSTFKAAADLFVDKDTSHTPQLKFLRDPRHFIAVAVQGWLMRAMGRMSRLLTQVMTLPFTRITKLHCTYTRSGVSRDASQSF